MNEKPTSELAPAIAQAQEDVRAKGMCGAVYDDPVKGECMCIRDPHTGPHGFSTTLPASTDRDVGPEPSA